MSLKSAVGGNGGQVRWPRRWLLGLVVLTFVLWLGVLALSAAQAAGNIYVANQGSANVSQYAIGAGGLLSPLTQTTVATGSEPLSVAVTPDGRSAYVTNAGNGTVSQYTVDPVTGALSPKSPPTVAASEPAGVAVTPDGRSAYVTNNNDSVSQYNIDPVTGVLSPKTPATVPAGPEPLTVAVTPNGKSAYVPNNLGGVSQYNIDPVTGVLSPKTPATVPAGAFPAGVAITPDGKSAYVTNSGAGIVAFGSISQYDIDPVTGALSPKTPATISTSGRGGLIAVTPDGKSLYITEVNDAFNLSAVAQFDIAPVTGALSPKTPATVAAGSAPDSVAVTPDGRSAYVTNFFSNAVSQYSIDPVTEALSANNPSTVPAGTNPVGIAVTPRPRLHPSATSASCSPRAFAPGDATVCRATVTDTGSRGQSTPTGTVSFTNSGGGRFVGNPCTLSGNGPSASCAVFFTAFPRGGRIIAAGYGGDATHSASSAITGVTVAVPASTTGCVVFGHGRITAANGDRASFRGLVAATPPRGVEFYRDNGPADAMRVVSTRVDALTCTDDATKASVFGAAKVNGAGAAAYRIDVQLTAWERGRDTYRIRLSNGYDSGAHQIRHGDVDIHIHTSEHHHHNANADHRKHGTGQDGVSSDAVSF